MDTDNRNVLLYIIIIILLVFAGFTIINGSNAFKTQTTNCPICPVCTPCQNDSSQQNVPPQQIPQYVPKQQETHNNVNIDVSPSGDYIRPPPSPPILPTNPIRDYDYRTLKDPLVPPYKRSDYLPVPSFPTRGLAGGFKKMGTLIDETAANADPYKFLILMGRPRYMGSNWYDYYATSSKDNSMMKFNIGKNKKEIMTDDVVMITELNKSYIAKIDPNVEFTYNPYII